MDDLPEDDQHVHVFDQTNGVIPPAQSPAVERRDDGRRDRFRQQSSAHAYAMWAAGNQ